MTSASSSVIAAAASAPVLGQAVASAASLPPWAGALIAGTMVALLGWLGKRSINDMDAKLDALKEDARDCLRDRAELRASAALLDRRLVAVETRCEARGHAAPIRGEQ